MSASLVTITVPSREEARALARALVEARLAASVNILAEIESVYWWQGALRDGAETLLLAKTRTDLVARLVDFVSARHAYLCPCVIATPIAAGNPDYLAWIEAETTAARDGDPDGSTR